MALGVLRHRGAAQVNIHGARRLSIKVYLHRNVGGGKGCQYLAVAKVGQKQGTNWWRRKAGERVSRNVCASTPTKATKAALRALLKRI